MRGRGRAVVGREGASGGGASDRRVADRGAVSLELALLVPALLLAAMLTAAGWRLWQVHGDAQAAAEAAARAASVAPGPRAATSEGRAAASSELVGTRCGNPVVTLDVAALAAPVGHLGSVHASVGCTVDLSDLLVPGLPGLRHVRAAASAPVDSHRERS